MLRVESVLFACLRDRAFLFSGGSLPSAKSGWDGMRA